MRSIDCKCLVQNIMNVNDVITDISSDEDAYWRAVPSLREIWSEERHRMSVFLDSEDDFLNVNSDKKSPSFTLSVKKGADASASRSALKGVKKLYDDVDSSLPNLKNAYRQTMSDILEKHNQTLERLGHFLLENNVENDVFTSPKARLNSQDEAVVALAALHDQFKSMSTPLSAKSLSQGDTLSQFSARRLKPFTQAEINDVEDEFAFARDLDIGRRIDKVDEDIDPFTLTPYDDDENAGDFHDEEEHMGEEGFERCLTALQTQDIPSRKLFGERIDPKTTKSLTDNDTDGFSENEELSNRNNSDGLDQHSNEGILSRNSESISLKSPLTPLVNKDSTHALFSESSLSSTSGCDRYFQPRRRPPLRGECMKNNVRWHRVSHIKNRSVDWLGYSSRNNVDQSKDATGMCFLENLTYIQSISKAPTTKLVSKWLRRQKNDTILQALNHTESCSKQTIKRAHPENNLIFDNNSKKLKLNTEPSTKKRVLFADTSGISSRGVGEVEEMTWFQSSPNTSQDSSKGTNKSRENVESAKTLIINETVDVVHTELSGVSVSSSKCDDSATFDPLQGIGNAGGRINVEGVGGLKAETGCEKGSNVRELPSPEVFVMAIEVHVQCRKGKAGINDSTLISMKADPSRDPIFAVTYAYALDPGKGEKIKILQRGCIFVPSRSEFSSDSDASEILSKIGKTMGITSEMKVETVQNEKKLLLRIAAIVRQKDPDALMSWDTRSRGLGYLIDRGDAISDKEDINKQKIDMVRLLGRTPNFDKAPNTNSYGHLFDTVGSSNEPNFNSSKPIRFGSGLGSDWDDDVGAGVGPSSIVGRLVSISVFFLIEKESSK